MKSYIKFVDGTTEPILEWLTPRESRNNDCRVLAESGEYRLLNEPQEVTHCVSEMKLPLLIPDYVFYKLHRRWFAYGINEDWVRVNNIECFVEDMSDELSEVEA